MIFLSRFAPRLIDGLFLLVLLKIALAADGTRTDSSHSRNEVTPSPLFAVPFCNNNSFLQQDSTDGCNCDRHSGTVTLILICCGDIDELIFVLVVTVVGSPGIPGQKGDFG